MGIKRHLSYRDSWSSSQNLRDPYISIPMTVNHFCLLLAHINLNDNTLMPKKIYIITINYIN